MALKLRPNGLKHPDDERKDYTVHCRNLEIGRIYEVERHGRTASFEEAKAQFSMSVRSPEALAPAQRKRIRL